MLFTLALLALLVLAWLSYSVVLALLERRDRRDLYKRAAAEIRRRPPTMPPRTPRPAKGFFGSIPPYPMPAPAPPHVSTMPYGEGPRIADSDVSDDMLRQLRDRFEQTQAAQLAKALGVPSWQIRSGSIMDNPPPYVQQAMDELERPARNQKILQERRACRPPLDHSSDADPWLDAK